MSSNVRFLVAVFRGLLFVERANGLPRTAVRLRLRTWPKIVALLAFVCLCVVLLPFASTVFENRDRLTSASPAHVVELLRRFAWASFGGRQPWLSSNVSWSLEGGGLRRAIEDAQEREKLPEFKVIAGAASRLAAAPPRANTPHDGWTRQNGNDSSDKFSDLTQINAANADQLQLAWVHHGSRPGAAGTAPTSVQMSPVVLGQHIFHATSSGDLVCIDGKDGREVWRATLAGGVRARGMTIWRNTDLGTDVLFVPAASAIYAVDPLTGRVLSRYGIEGRFGDVGSMIAPVVAEDRLIIATFAPSIDAYSIKTGKLLWRHGLRATRPGFALGGTPWSGMSYDAARRAVFVATGNPIPANDGAERPGDNPFTDSVTSIDVASGSTVWTFQETPHDLWDLDVVSAPILATIRVDGKPLEVVAQVTKRGNTLVLDRGTGEAIFDYRMRRAPVSTMPFERTAPYQAALQTPEPFAKQSFGLDDVTDLTSSARATVAWKIEGAKFGFAQPPVPGGTIVSFGLNGGAEWPGAAVDPNAGTLFVPSNEFPWLIRSELQDEKATPQEGERQPANALYQKQCSSCHGAARNGRYQIESEGDLYYPALTGITYTRERQDLVSTERFRRRHEMTSFAGKNPPADLEALYDYFRALDQISDKRRSFKFHSYWQLLLDDKGRPGSKPPWGRVSAIDLNTGRIKWAVPFGSRSFEDGAFVHGLKSYGGVIATAGGIVVATGSFDSKVYILDARSGQALWSYRLPASGSAPPATYMVDGKQYLLVNATGHWATDSGERSDQLLAFRLP